MGLRTGEEGGITPGRRGCFVVAAAVAVPVDALGFTAVLDGVLVSGP
jgi:hypothetical protein